MSDNVVPPASSWKEAEENILMCTAQIMNQAIEILRSKAIDDASYKFESKIMGGSTPGKHFRHVLDHLRILVDAIEDWQSRAPSSSSQPASTPSATFSQSSHNDPSRILRVDYDSRIASKLPHIETSASASLKAFEQTTSRLYEIFKGSNGRLYTQPLRLCATTPFVVEMDSTIGRELWFCGLHAIHHYALARVILVKELGLKGIDDQFGVAPSTLVHREYRKESNRADVAVDALEQGQKDELPSTGKAVQRPSQSGASSRSSSRRAKGQTKLQQRTQSSLKSKL